MNQQKNIKVLAFVGLGGSGKSTAVDYLRDRHYPEIHHDYNQLDNNEDSTPAIIEQIANLAAVGQHKILLDDITSLSEYKKLKHALPGELIVIALVASKHARHHRLAARLTHPMTDTQAQQRDWADVEEHEKAGPIILADHYLINNDSLSEFKRSIDQLLININF